MHRCKGLISLLIKQVDAEVKSGIGLNKLSDELMEYFTS